MERDFHINCIFSILKNQLFRVPIDIETLKSDAVDWELLFDTASRQGVLPILIQYVSEQKSSLTIEKDLVLKWRQAAINQVLYSEKLIERQAVIIRVLDSERIPYAILKGTSTSCCYPRPELRPFGDIDLLVSPDDLEKTVDVLCAIGYRRSAVESTVHKVLDKDGVRVEPHFTVADIPDNIAGQNIKALLRHALHYTETVQMGENTFSVLSSAHQAIALLLHIEKHITKRGLDLRRLCDWAVFVEKRTSIYLWETAIQPMLIQCGLSQFAKIMTKVCVIYLGLNKENCLWAYSDAHDDAHLCENLMGMILKSCDLEYKQMNLAIQLSIEKKKSDDGRSMVRTIFSNITVIAVRDFPLCKKVPIFFPVIWVYCAIDNIIRYKTDAGMKTSFIKSFIEARRVKKIFKDLKLFQPE